MKLRLFAQILIAIIIFLIIGLFYYFYLIEKNIKTTKANENSELQDKKTTNFKNELLNIEYNSKDSRGNIYYLNAKKGIIINEGSDINKIKLEGVTSILSLKDRGIINIYSNYAIYDKILHDTLFFNQVKIEYLDNFIVAENFDVIFSEEESKIYNNVIFENSSVNLFTDTILIDMISGNIKLKMTNKNKKVKLITKNEFIN